MHILRAFPASRSILFNIRNTALAFILLFGCKKKDSDPPVIVFHQPAVQQTFNYGDEIVISVTVSDNERIDYVRFEILDGSLPVLSASLVQGIDATEIELNESISFDDIHLASGTYILRVTASDGENEKNVFREINLNGAPKILENVYLVRMPSEGTSLIDSLNSNQGWDNIQTLSMSYDVGELNSYRQDLAIAGRDFDGIQVLTPTDFFQLQQIDTPFAGGPDYFLNVELDPYENHIYISSLDSKIRVLGEDGQLITQVLMQGDFNSHEILVTPDYIITYEKNISGFQKKVAAYHKISGQLFLSLPVTHDVFEILETGDEHEFIVLGNESGQSDFELMDVVSNTLTDLDFVIDISTSEANYACRKNESQYYVSHVDGIQLFNEFSPETFGTISLTPLQMKYDVVGNALYVLDENNLYVLSGSAQAILQTIPVPADTKDFFLFYNK